MKNTLPEFKLDKFEITDINALGQGSYGKVFRGKSKQNGQDVAIKQINMVKIKQEGLEKHLKRQIDLMVQLQSANIVRLYDYCWGDDYTYMVLELCEADLRKFLRNCQVRLSEQKCLNIFLEVMKGFRVMIQHSCIHRDIKPENILIKGEEYKVADLGFACKADIMGKQKLDDICGTPIYMAPQLLRNQPYTAKCDIWSLGLILYELMYGYPPWPMKNPVSYLESIKKRPLTFPFDVKIGKNTKDFLKKTLQTEQAQRLGWEQLFKHPLIADHIVGEVSITQYVEPKVRRILSSVQRQAQRSFIDQIEVFKKYEDIQGMNPNQFRQLMVSLNPTITTNEINTLFEACDQNKDSIINKAQFQKMFTEVNFRTNSEIERQLDELIGIIHARKINAGELFDLHDLNHTGALDTKQFKIMVLSIAPTYNEYQVLNKLYKNFDQNGNGLVEKKEFIKVVGRGVFNQQNYKALWLERAERNVRTFKYFLKDKGLSYEDVMKIGDLNEDKHIGRQEFTKLFEKLNYQTSQAQIDEIFKLIDQNQSDNISILQLYSFMK